MLRNAGFCVIFERLSPGSLEITIDREPSRENAQSMTDLANIAEISVRRVIHMAKTVKSFKALPQADQISLLKGGSIELLILRSVITFDKDKQHFLDPYDKEDTSAMSMEQVRMVTIEQSAAIALLFRGDFVDEKGVMTPPSLIKVDLHFVKC